MAARYIDCETEQHGGRYVLLGTLEELKKERTNGKMKKRRYIYTHDNNECVRHEILSPLLQQIWKGLKRLMFPLIKIIHTLKQTKKK